MNAITSFVFTLLLAAAGFASAQGYPAKAIRIIVPFPPVGAADLLTRTIGQKLTEAWGQQIVVDNRPGAGGNLGVELAAKSPPDGYTAVMAAVTTNAIGMSTYSGSATTSRRTSRRCRSPATFRTCWSRIRRCRRGT